MTSALCLCVCGGKSPGGGGWGVLRSVHPDETRSQSLLFTDGPFTGPARPSAPPSQFSSAPYRIPLSGASGVGGGGVGALPLMFSLGTGCSLFDFQSKQRKHLQFEQIVQCWPTDSRPRREGPDSAASDPPTGAVTDQRHAPTQRQIGKIFLHCLLKNQSNPIIVWWGRRFQATRTRWDFLNRCHWHQTAPEVVLIHQLGQNVAKRWTLPTNLLHMSTTGLKYDPGIQL